MQTNPILDPGIEFRRAAAEGNIDKVRNLLNKNYINHQSSNGNTALHWSIINQHYAITKVLLTNADIDVDAQNKLGCTPLHLATKQGDKRVVYRLLKSGAGQKNRTHNEGFSPLDHAFAKSNSFIVTQLKNKHPNMTFKNEDKLAEQAYERFKANHPNLIRNRKVFDPNYLFDDNVVRYFLPDNKFSLADIKKL